MKFEMLMVAVVLAGPSAAAEGRSFEVAVVGRGRPVVLIPGLSSSGQVWAKTVDALRDRHQCHVLTLAGFGGVKPVEGAFLPRVREELVAYLKANKLERPVLIGHSLGATLALWVAATAPEQVGGVVAVDGVPFLPGLMDPSASPESVRPQANAMRARYAQMSSKQFEEANAQALQSMVTAPEALAELLPMANSSDPRTVGKAVAELLSTDLRTEVARIRARVLLVVSAPWAVTPDLEQRAVDTYAAQIAKVSSHEVVLIPHARHFVMYDAPVELNGRIAAFLGGGK